MSSIFTRPRARPPLAAVSSQQNLIAVSTEDELLAALTSLPRSDGACYGRGINIVSDISVKQPIYLAPQHSGLTITSSSKSKLSSTKSIECVFNVGATLSLSNLRVSDVTIENLYLDKSLAASYFIVNSSSLSSLAVKNIIVDPQNTNISSFVKVVLCNTLYISGCDANISIPIIQGSFSTTVASNVGILNNVGFYGGIDALSLRYCLISSNLNFGGWSTSSSPSSAASSEANIFSMNTIVTGRNIVISNSFSKNNSIVGNSFIAGGSINTSATAGSNSIVANVGVTTITNAATDAVTSNT